MTIQVIVQSSTMKGGDEFSGLQMII